MENKFTLTLSDGTILENIGLTGNNWISEEKIDDSVFNDEALKHVTIENVDTGDVEELVNQTLVQNIEYNGEYWFIFREKGQVELLAERVEEQTAIIADLQERVEELESGYPYVIATIDAVDSPGGEGGGPDFTEKVHMNKLPINQFEIGHAVIENFTVDGENLGTITVEAYAVYNEGIAGSVGADVCDKLVGNIEITWKKGDFSNLYAYIDNETESQITPPYSWDGIAITMTGKDGE